MVVDDHRMIVQALVLALSREPDIEVVATASDGVEAVRSLDCGEFGMRSSRKRSAPIDSSGELRLNE